MKRQQKPPHDLRLLIADRHTLFAEGLRRLLEDCEEIESVAVATTEREASRRARSADPDVILLDPWLNGSSPFVLLRRLRQVAPRARFLFLEDGIQEIHVQVAVKANAAGFLTKFCPFEEVRDVIGKIVLGQPTYCSSVQKYLVHTPRGPRFNRSAVLSPLAGLTPRELEVAMFLVQGYTVRETGDQMNVAASTVDNHKSRLMKKLDIHKVVDLATLVLREGLMT